MPARVLPFVVLGFGVVVVSFAAILIRFALAEGASSLAIAAIRLTVAAAVLAPFVWLRAGAEILRLRRRELGLCALSGALLAMDHFPRTHFGRQQHRAGYHQCAVGGAGLGDLLA